MRKAVKNELGIGREQWTGYTQMLDAIAKVKLDVAKANQIMGEVFELKNDPSKDDKRQQSTHREDHRSLQRQGYRRRRRWSNWLGAVECHH